MELTNIKVIVALNMADILEKKGIFIDEKKLQPSREYKTVESFFSPLIKTFYFEFSLFKAQIHLIEFQKHGQI